MDAKPSKMRSPRRCQSRRSLKMKAEPPPILSNEPLNSLTEFMSLNDYCIDEICEWLPLSSLASLGLTCSRLNQVASSYFRRKHPANYVTISLSIDGNIRLSPDQPYVHCFSDQFQSITIYGVDLSLFHFAASKFKEKRIKKFSFFAADLLTEEHARIIADILKNAEVIEFIRCSTIGSLYEILKYCSNMKTLVLKSLTECKHYGKANEWLLQKHTKLKHLQWNLSPTMIPTEFRAFFQQNPNVGSFYANEHLLPFFRMNQIQLKTLILKLKTYYIFSNKFDDLRRMFNEQAFQTLYLIGDLGNVDQTYPTLTNVEGICSGRIKVIPIAEIFPRLKFLKAEIRSMQQAKDIATQFVHLEEAYIDVSQIDYIVPLVRYARTLKKIYIDNTIAMKPGNKLSRINLNKQRNKLNGASNLTIYLNENAYLKIKCMSICNDNCLIHFRTIESHVSDNVFVNTILDK